MGTAIKQFHFYLKQVIVTLIFLSIIFLTILYILIKVLGFSTSVNDDCTP